MTVIDIDARKTSRNRVLDTGLIRFGDMSISCSVRNVQRAVLRSTSVRRAAFQISSL
jgi:hypothetical protein